MRKRATPHLTTFKATTMPPRACDHPDCDKPAEFRAPKSPQQLNEYYWFCLEHVKIYNETWDFYDGMNESAIEASRRDDVTWNRPTWKLGEHHSFRPIFANEQAFRERIFRSFFKESSTRKAHKEARAPISEAIHQALATLDLAFPVDIKTIKTQYKKLAKQLHPDVHGGQDNAAEERLKDINQAYSLLKHHQDLFASELKRPNR